MVLSLTAAFAGCATTGDPTSVGSDAWYEHRIAEIDAAHENGDINKEEYLRLKVEADQIHAESRRSRGYSGLPVSFHIGVFSSH